MPKPSAAQMQKQLDKASKKGAPTTKAGKAQAEAQGDAKPKWFCSTCTKGIFTPRHTSGICLSCRVAARREAEEAHQGEARQLTTPPKAEGKRQQRRRQKNAEAARSPRILRDNPNSNTAHMVAGDGSISVVNRFSETYQAAAAERILAERVLCRRRFLPFVQRMNKKYAVAIAHEILARRLERFLEDCVAGRSPRLMITFPPRHGKSEQTSRKFPAWALGKYPDMEIILASYGSSLAMKMSKSVQGTMQDPEYKVLFPDAVLANEAVEDWQTTAGGGVRAAGVGGGITGMGCRMLIIDDPFKDRAEADSEVVRDNTWDWYTSTALTRLAPGGGVLIINTRWHDDDLSGHLLSMMQEDDEFERWEVVNFAALAEEDEYLTPDDRIVNTQEPGSTLFRRAGEALHEERYSRKYLLNLKRILPPRDWNSLYQQNPVPDDGEYFKKDYFIELDQDAELHNGDAYIAADFAITEKNSSDYTVIPVGLLMPNDTLHIDDMLRFRSGDGHRIVGALLDTFHRYRMHNPVMGVEDGQIWRSLRSLFEAEAKRRKIYVRVELLKPLTDKQARARPLQGRMANHMVTFRKGAKWMEILQHELLRFPVGKHDDIVDALAWMAQLVLTKTAPRPRQPPQTRRDSYGGKTVAEQIAALLRGTGSHMSA